MTDTFERELKFKFTSEADCWELLSAVQSRAERSLREISPNISEPEISVTAKSGSRFARDTLDEGRQALEENDEKLSYVAFDQSALAEPNKSWTWQAKVSALGIVGTKHLVVKVTGRSKVAVEGIASTLAPLKTARAGSAATVSATAQAASATTASAAPTQTKDDATSQEHGSSGSWLKRTWRDHAAAFVITVGGGLIVIAIAVALRLTH